MVEAVSRAISDVGCHFMDVGKREKLIEVTRRLRFMRVLF